jgi:hypothetical protein
MAKTKAKLMVRCLDGFFMFHFGGQLKTKPKSATEKLGDFILCIFHWVEIQLFKRSYDIDSGFQFRISE